MSELIHVTATSTELVEEALRLSEHRAQAYLTEGRKEQLTKQMDRIFFELQARNEVVLLGAA